MAAVEGSLITTVDILNVRLRLQYGQFRYPMCQAKVSRTGERATRFSDQTIKQSCKMSRLTSCLRYCCCCCCAEYRGAAVAKDLAAAMVSSVGIELGKKNWLAAGTGAPVGDTEAAFDVMGIAPEVVKPEIGMGALLLLTVVITSAAADNGGGIVGLQDAPVAPTGLWEDIELCTTCSMRRIHIAFY